MPELPEVETIARTLAPHVRGRRVTGHCLLNPGTLQGDVPLSILTGGTFAAPGRRGKLLLLPLHVADADDGPDAVIGVGIHLKMSGRLFVYLAGTEPGPHTRLIFDLDDGSRLFFDDARKFGYARVLTPAVLAAWPFWTRLGPEPLEIDAAAFAARFAARAAAIKALLLDQTVLAGCGNIYADESLFRAGIRPETRASTLSPERLHGLHAALQEVLRESIAACGSSIRDYRTARGDAGAFQNSFRVYGRSGERCLACGAKLRACKVAGRATVYCPRCQK